MFDFVVGSVFNNDIEVSHNAVRVEVMLKWVDDDATNYYILKCREVFNVTKDGDGRYKGNFPWFYKDEVTLVDGFTLYKYYSQEN
jgi:hypothetical protein